MVHLSYQDVIHLVCTLDELVAQCEILVWVGKADARTLSRWTPLQGDWWGEIGGPAGSKTPEFPGIGLLSHTAHAHSQRLVLMTTVRNFTLYLNGCKTGGEEDGGRWEEKGGKKEQMK